MTALADLLTDDLPTVPLSGLSDRAALLFACDCLERSNVLRREVDPEGGERMRVAIEVTRRYADGATCHATAYPGDSRAAMHWRSEAALAFDRVQRAMTHLEVLDAVWRKEDSP